MNVSYWKTKTSLYMTQEFFSTDGQRVSLRDGPIKFSCIISNNVRG